MLAEDDETVYEVTPSDIEGYAWKLTFTTVDLLGVALTYTIHYNEIPDPEDASPAAHRRCDDLVRRRLRPVRHRDRRRRHRPHPLHRLARRRFDRNHRSLRRRRSEIPLRRPRRTASPSSRWTCISPARTERSSPRSPMRRRLPPPNIVSDGFPDGTGFEIAYSYEKNGEIETGRMGVRVEFDETNDAYMYQYDVEAQTGPHAGHSTHSGGRSEDVRIIRTQHEHEPVALIHVLQQKSFPHPESFHPWW
ncbi:MAG: hypothetical protein MZU97_12960 [Bacillus subtilis]|nr:hypothetical protein [Bacillus subtilis]